MQKLPGRCSRSQLEVGFGREAAEVLIGDDDLLDIAVEPVGRYPLFESPPELMHGVLATAGTLRQATRVHGGRRRALRHDQLGRVDANQFVPSTACGSEASAAAGGGRVLL